MEIDGWKTIRLPLWGFRPIFRCENVSFREGSHFSMAIRIDHHLNYEKMLYLDLPSVLNLCLVIKQRKLPKGRNFAYLEDPGTCSLFPAANQSRTELFFPAEQIIVQYVLYVIHGILMNFE